MNDQSTRAERHPDATVIQPRQLWFRAGRRYSGRAARGLLRRMKGHTGAICDIRNPPLFARGVNIDWAVWPVAQVEFARLPRRRVSHGTVAPFGVRLRPGSYHIALCDKSGGLVKSAPFEVVRGQITLVTVFPPTTFLRESKNVRRVATVEVSTAPGG